LKLEIGRRSQVLLGGAWDFLFLGEIKRRVHTEDTEVPQRAQSKEIGRREETERSATLPSSGQVVGGTYDGEN
jgi:hypothetical protein